jgi:membrane protease YdiL (CAAX protease family)
MSGSTSSFPTGRRRERASTISLPAVPGFYRLAWGFYLALAIAGGIWVSAREGSLPAALFLDPQRWWLDLGLGVAAGGGLLAVWRLLKALLPAGEVLEQHFAGLLAGLEPGRTVALATLSGFAEELFFRGAVQGQWGLVPASLIFGLLHTGPGAPFRLWTVFATVAGFTLGGLALWRGNLLAPIVAHFVLNAVNLRRLAGAEKKAL